MSKTRSHKLKSERFLKQFLETPPALLEMRQVALFYCALHLVEMVSSTLNPPVSHNNHIKRNDWLEEHLPGVWKHYRPLFEMAWDARYIADTPTINAEAVEDHYYKIRLGALEKWAIEKMGTNGALTRPVIVAKEIRVLPSVGTSPQAAQA